MRRILSIIALTIPLMVSAQTTNEMLIRISEIEIHPEYLNEYLAFAQNVGAESVAKEPGVICIYPMIQQRDSCQIRILEIYRDMEAYKQHIASDHFQTYKQGTLHMVKSLDLVDMYPIKPEGMADIFRKMIKNNNAMEFREIVSERYACRSFSSEKISREILSNILVAGRLAPTAKNLQEQRIYVVESEEGLAKIDATTPCRYGAQTCIVVAFDKTNVFTYPGGQRDSGIEDATIVATHMLLAAKSEGVETCWINNFDPDKFAKLLGLPENEEVLMVLDLGYPADGAGPGANHFKRKPQEETVTYL